MNTVRNLEITEVKIRKVFSDPSSSLKGIISVTFNECLVIHDIRVIYTEERKFLAMPSRKDESNIFRDIVNPIDAELRRYMEDVSLDAFERYIDAIEAVEIP